jgi:hypothetical protein
MARSCRRAALAVAAVAVAATASLAAAAPGSSCAQAGCDARHSNSAGGALPNDYAPPRVETTFDGGGTPAGPLAHPLLVTSDATALLLSVATNGNVTALRRDFGGVPAWWAPPAAGGGPASFVAAAQAVVATESAQQPSSASSARVVLVLARNTTSPGAPGGSVLSYEAWGLTAAAGSGGPALTAAWGPSALPGPQAGPLVAVAGVVYGTGEGGLLAVDAATGGVMQLLGQSAFSCAGGDDAPAPASGPVLLTPPSGGGGPLLLGVVTSHGCAVGITVAAGGAGPANIGWRRDRPAVLTLVSAMSSPPSSTDAGAAGGSGGGLMFAASDDGWVCCYTYTARGAPCAGWAGAPTASPDGQCVLLTGGGAAGNGTSGGAGAPLPPGVGLALSPAYAVADFHGGALYTLDAGGWVWEVTIPTGGVAVTRAALRAPLGGGAGAVGLKSAYRVTPLLVPNGFGPRWHGLVVVAPSGAIHALSVGDVGTPTDDDDYGETDDDGAVTTGGVWTLRLGSGAVAITAPSLSLTPEGRLLLPDAVSGRVFVVGSSRDGGADPFPDTPLAVEGAVGIALGAVVLVLALVMVAGRRARLREGAGLQARALIRAGFLAEWGHLQRARERARARGLPWDAKAAAAALDGEGGDSDDDVASEDGGRDDRRGGGVWGRLSRWARGAGGGGGSGLRPYASSSSAENGYGDGQLDEHLLPPDR